MKFYIATGFQNREPYRQLRDLLLSAGHELTLDWTEMQDPETGSPEEWASVATREAVAVAAARVVVVMFPAGRGTHVEMGIALIAPRDKYEPARKVVLCAPSTEVLLGDGKGVPFYHLADRTLTGTMLEIGTALLGLMREWGDS